MIVPFSEFVDGLFGGRSSIGVEIFTSACMSVDVSAGIALVVVAPV